ncbi:TraR/DksA family transcriptional regulator [Pelagibacteraceae bacterium]|nr:TraR/DksA family transcriptional regulator [Pelagibacteraceae bacterium]
MPKKPLKKPIAKASKKLIKKRYIPNNKEKYMCTKHKQFFKEELLKWKKDIIKSNSLTNLLNSSDDNVSSADMVDQASSYTDKSVEMKALTRSRKLIEKIDGALRRIKDDTYGYCEETSEPIGIKRLMARPIATLSIEAQERHERDEKIFIDD